MIKFIKLACSVDNRVSSTLISATLLALASCAVYYYIRKRRIGKLSSDHPNGKPFFV